jgi:hypothetical protein
MENKIRICLTPTGIDQFRKHFEEHMKILQVKFMATTPGRHFGKTQLQKDLKKIKEKLVTKYAEVGPIRFPAEHSTNFHLKMATKALSSLGQVGCSAAEAMRSFNKLESLQFVKHNVFTVDSFTDDLSLYIAKVKNKKLIKEDNSVLYSRRQAIYWANSWVEHRNKSRASHSRFPLQSTKCNTGINRRLT